MPHSRTTTALIAILGVGLSACNSMMPWRTPNIATMPIPSDLEPTAKERRAFTVYARGVQIYTCELKEGAAPNWNFVAPEATLYDTPSTNVAVGSHGAGPFWEARDGSKVIGKVKARADAPTETSIPWLLLTTTSAGGAGKMANVSSVQRINTYGGVAPTTGCAKKEDAGKTVRVPYSSDYVFFASGG